MSRAAGPATALSLALGMLLAPVSAPAQAPPTAFFNHGEGTERCGDYLRAVEAERKVRPPNVNAPESFWTMAYNGFASWADGYLSAANVNDLSHPNAGKGTTHDARMRWLENIAATTRWPTSSGLLRRCGTS